MTSKSDSSHKPTADFIPSGSSKTGAFCYRCSKVCTEKLAIGEKNYMVCLSCGNMIEMPIF